MVHQWLKKAILLSFRLHDPHEVEGGPDGAAWWDKVPTKFAKWKAKDFKEAGFRVVPGAVVRRSAYIAPGVVLMPSFVNLGARVDTGTMVDTWATVGSCAQIGKNVHLSGGAGIGGVLEPLQANPVIIEDNCFIGARAEVAEGVIVGEGSVLSMGVYLGQSTKIVDRADRLRASGPRAALLGRRVGHHARQAARRRGARPFALLRRDREDGRREDPRQDLDQRAAQGLTSQGPRRWTGPGSLALFSFKGRIQRLYWWLGASSSAWSTGMASSTIEFLARSYGFGRRQHADTNQFEPTGRARRSPRWQSVSSMCGSTTRSRPSACTTANRSGWWLVAPTVTLLVAISLP